MTTANAKDSDVLLLPSAADDEGPSMRRYARELYMALTGLPGGTRSIALEAPAPRRYVSRLVDRPQARRFDRAWVRYVAYPRSLRQRRTRLFHILDHGYAHLIRSLDADRTVVTCHDLIPLLAAEGRIRLQIPATVARSFRWRVAHLARARMVIAVSNATKTALTRYTSVQPDRIRVIPQGVNAVFRPAAERRPATRAHAGVDPAARVLLQVASASPYKNTPLLIEALSRLRTTAGNVTLVRIGAPLLPDERALAARLGVVSAIRDLGSVAESTLVDWYNAADVLVFPSVWEGFGWPPLEAMACGTPVVASNIPPVAEVVAQAGLLVPPNDAAGFENAIVRVLTEGALAASLRTQGLSRAGEYTWARTAMATAAVYEEMLQ